MGALIGKIMAFLARVTLVKALWKAIRGVFSLFVPIGKRVFFSRELWWLVHLCLIGAALYGLYVLQGWLMTRASMPNPLNESWPRLARYWLVILGLTFYAIAWIMWWIWKLLLDDVPSYHPDIDAAWEEGKRALAKAGIDVRNRPLFLVLGRPESGESNLLEAADMKLDVPPAPGRPDAPLRVFADGNSIYVTCAGVSLLGRLAGILALEEMGHGESAAGDGAPRDDASKTIVPGRGHREIVQDLEEVGKNATTLQRRRMRRNSQMPLGPDFLADPAEVRRRKSRLAHLCYLIVRDREPFCPINAIMLLVPLGGTDTDRDAQQAADAVSGDLDTIRSVFQLECSVLAVLGDMETLPGFSQFMQGQSAEDKKRRFGQRYPLATNLKREQTLEQIRDSIGFLGNDYVQQSISKHFQFETPDQPGLGPSFETNSALVLLMDEMRMRAGPLSRVIEQAVARDKHLWRYGGCYLAATGEKGQQAFVPQLFERLFQNRNAVNWSDEILAEDQKCQSQRSLGYFLIALAWAGLIAYVAWRFRHLYMG
jgi:hypothetical protein